MLKFEDLVSYLWIIPGCLFLFSHNRLRRTASEEITGWRYVFSLALVSLITTLPVYFIIDIISHKSPLLFLTEIIPINYIKTKLTDIITKKSHEIKLIISVTIASIMAFLLPFFLKFIQSLIKDYMSRNPSIFTVSTFSGIIRFFLPLSNKDEFINACIDSEGKPILLTIDSPLYINNDDQPFTIKTTTIFGLLAEFPDVSSTSTSFQAIRIYPLLTGYKNIWPCKLKESFIWTKIHQIRPTSLGVVIPREKIILFEPYVKKDHDKAIFDEDEET